MAITTQMICGDARNLSSLAVLKERPVRTIITSPPYLNTQDYGVPGQIGFGQQRKQYLTDLRWVFEQCADLSAADATMWLVVGAVRRNGRLIQLPEILTHLAAEVGWIPREQITWAKGKSLPWARRGEFRDVTEQAILLSKSDSFVFDLSDFLSPDPKSIWWRRYPERYSPRGRRLTNLWNIPIPTQGSWREGPGHLCPFPDELTFRMISLTSEPGDVVLDPFAGIGSVPAMADAMGRLGYGVDISQEYVDRFSATLKQSQKWFTRKKNEIEKTRFRRRIFYDTIVELRLLKFGNIIGKHLVENGYPVEWIHVSSSPDKPAAKYKIITGVFEIKVLDLGQQEEILQLLNEITTIRPLSKFGVQPTFHLTNSERSVAPEYWYEEWKFWLEPKTAKINDQYPHLTSDFRPRVEEVSEVIDHSEQTEQLELELEVEFGQ